MYHEVVRNRNSLLGTRVQKRVSGFKVSAFATAIPTEHRQRLDATCMCEVFLTYRLFDINVTVIIIHQSRVDWTNRERKSLD